MTDGRGRQRFRWRAREGFEARGLLAQSPRPRPVRTDRASDPAPAAVGPERGVPWRGSGSVDEALLQGVARDIDVTVEPGLFSNAA